MIPVFDSLLPEPHNTYVLNVLFDLAHWHGLAKLHMHTDLTLKVFADITTSLSKGLHAFKTKTCGAFAVQKLECERDARAWRQAKTTVKAVAGSSKSKIQKCDGSVHLPKELNLKMYKYHVLGDYVSTIWCLGTMDLYSIQLVSLSSLVRPPVC